MRTAARISAFFGLLCGLLLAPSAAFALVNINTASKEDLMTVTGLGGTGVKAQAVIDYRNANGPFAAIEDIMNVSGIGQATFDGMKNQITVSGTTVLDAEDSDTSTSTANVTNGNAGTSSGGSSRSKPPSSLKVSIVGSATVVAGADARFEAEVTADGSRTHAGSFAWSFGDGSAGKGETVTHVFERPGKYVVVANVSLRGEEAEARLTVEAVPLTLAFVAEPDGAFSLENKTKEEIDASYWSIVLGSDAFIFPNGTIVLAGETLYLPHTRAGFHSAAGARLLFSNGGVAAVAALPSVKSAATGAGSTFAARTTSAPSLSATPSINASDLHLQNHDSDSAEASSLFAAASAAGAVLPAGWSYGLGLAALIALGAAGTVYAQRMSPRLSPPAPEDEFEIEEKNR